MRIEIKAHELMAAAGPALDLFAVDEYEAEGTWHIAFDQDTVAFAELDAARGMLVLSAAVGVPAGKDRMKLYEQLLHYNHLWNSTSGMRFSIDEPDGVIWLLADVAIEAIDNRAFAARLKNFSEKLVAWRGIVTSFGIEKAGKGDVPLSMQNVIRG